MRRICGLELRYRLVVLLLDEGRPLHLAELVATVERSGFRIGGRPAKTVSDAIRWEAAKGQVVRVGRGRYGPGTMPRSTEWYLRRRIGELSRSVA